MLRKRAPNALLAFVVAIFAMAWAPAGSASELTAYLGGQTFNSLDDCCQSVPFRMGYGVGIRLDSLGSTWEGFGYTDTKWAEVSILKTHYLNGEFAQGDIGGDLDLQVLRIKRLQFLASYGAGFFIHTTTTVKYNLPVVVNGILLVGHLEGQYMLNDRFSLVGLGRAGVAVGNDGFGYIGAALGGVLFRF